MISPHRRVPDGLRIGKKEDRIAPRSLGLVTIPQPLSTSFTNAKKGVNVFFCALQDGKGEKRGIPMAENDIGKMLREIAEHAFKASEFLEIDSITPSKAISARTNISAFATYARECSRWYSDAIGTGHAAREFQDRTPADVMLALEAIETSHANVCAVSRNFEKLSGLPITPAPVGHNFFEKLYELNDLRLGSAAHSLSWGIDVLYERLPNGGNKPAFPGWPPRRT